MKTSEIKEGTRIRLRGRSWTVDAVARYGYYQRFPIGTPRYYYATSDDGVRDTFPAETVENCAEVL